MHLFGSWEGIGNEFVQYFVMDSGAQVVIINMLTVPKTDMNLTLASYELYGDLGSVRLADERLGYPVRG